MFIIPATLRDAGGWWRRTILPRDVKVDSGQLLVAGEVRKHRGPFPIVPDLQVVIRFTISIGVDDQRTGDTCGIMATQYHVKLLGSFITSCRVLNSKIVVISLWN